jgi:hypothetical protein
MIDTYCTDSESALATQFEATNKHHLAAPLYLQALTFCPPKSCHTVILMNNLASSLAQQRPPPSFYESSTPSSSKQTKQLPVPTPADFRAQAALWAKKALTLSQSIAPPDRTDECDMGCAVATHNLGEFAEMSGNLSEASSRYQEAESLAKALNFEEGIKQAQQALIRVNVGAKGTKV